MARTNRRRNGARRPRGQRRRSNPTDVSPNAVVYRGPIAPRGGRSQNSTFEIVLTNVTSVDSTAAGSIVNVFGNSLGAFHQSGNFTPIFGEWRVLGVKYTYTPSYMNLPGTLVFAPMAVVVDRNSSSAFTIFNNAADFDSYFPGNPGTPFTRTVRMSNPIEADYITTATTTTARWWLKLYASGLTASTTYGYMTTRALIQFRGRIYA